ncbi:hypothetical protein J7I44_15720 [Frateuria sp. MAH-13]|uniref:N-acetyltransferase domain-containing protein n=1 Tax=Frateuria flava TaxID=2821489 RepID=A0ABS4DRS1_9GAMM|nr:hypothetical protein [Frateuria flava]MBP1475755.1 hypothetical protein [Frateuria flava]
MGLDLVGAVEARAREQGTELVVVRSNVERQVSHPFHEGLGFGRQKSQHVYDKRLVAP